jgi:uncharacterized membrane protein
MRFDSPRWAIALFLGLAFAARAAAQVTITDLPLPPGYTWTNGESINASGQVAGSSTTLGPPVYATRWTNGVPEILYALCPTCWSMGTGINDAGDVVGWSSENGPLGQVPAIWRNGVISALPMPAGDTRGSAVAINNHGDVIGSTSGGAPGVRGVIWRNGIPEVLAGTPRAINDAGAIAAVITGVGGVVIQPGGAITPLPVPAGSCGANSNPQGINELGQVVGSVPYVMIQGFCSAQAAVWNNGQVALLPWPVTASTSSVARQINERGEIAGYAPFVGTQQQATLWRNGEAIILGALPFTQSVASFGNGINDSGVVVGTSRIDRSTPAVTHAVTWTTTPPNTPPSLNVPADIVVNAESAAGAQVFFFVTADDAEDGTFNATCSPSNGEFFAIGTTTVSCGATDTGGLEATGSFNVTVLGAQEQAEEMLQQLGAGGPGGSLQNKLNDILESLGGSTQLLSASTQKTSSKSGGAGNTCAKLQAFIHEVSAQAGKKLTLAQAASLIDAAQRIRAIAGCS